MGLLGPREAPGDRRTSSSLRERGTDRPPGTAHGEPASGDGAPVTGLPAGPALRTRPASAEAPALSPGPAPSCTRPRARLPGPRVRHLPPQRRKPRARQRVTTPSADRLKSPALTQPIAGRAPSMRTTAQWRSAPCLGLDVPSGAALLRHLCTSFYLRAGMIPVGR